MSPCIPSRLLAVGLTGTNGVVAFSGTFDTDLTARVEAIASNTSVGDAAAFLDGSSNAYLFVKGSSDNLLVKVGSEAVSAINTLGINASRTSLLESKVQQSILIFSQNLIKPLLGAFFV